MPVKFARLWDSHHHTPPLPDGIMCKKMEISHWSVQSCPVDGAIYSEMSLTTESLFL